MLTDRDLTYNSYDLMTDHLNTCTHNRTNDPHIYLANDHSVQQKDDPMINPVSKSVIWLSI